MKVKFVNWPINNVGGIVTTCVGMIAGLRELGHDVEVLHINEGFRMKVPAEDTSTMLTGRYMSIRTEELLSEVMDTLNDADLVVFAHASPHPTKAQRAKMEGGRRWQHVYKRLTTKSVVYFHDNLWWKTNEWLAEVSDHVTHILAAQKMFTESAERYPGNRKVGWAYFPFVMDDVPLNTGARDQVLLMHTQWIRWKKHREFLAELPKSEFDYELYNDGIEYCYLRKEDIFNDYVTDVNRDTTANVEERAKMFGTVPHPHIRKRLREVAGSVDFSKRGYVNCTHWEALIGGGASFTHQDVLAQENCCLPREALVIPFNDDNFLKAQRDFMCMTTSEYQERQLFGYNFMKDNMSPLVIAKHLLEFVS